MTSLPKVGRESFIVLLVVFALVALASWLSRRTAPRSPGRPVNAYPELFGEAVPCPGQAGVLEHGRRSEQLARLRADRYAYDPRDGIRAVQRYREAEACYRIAGTENGVHRARRAAAALTARVNSDYAAARLNLVNALEQERWSDALSEIRRLLLLTDHVGRHEYVEWLERIVGRVVSKASTAS